MSKLARGGIVAIMIRWASRLRFPWLFALSALLFGANVLIPDALPFADELLLGLGALLLAKLKKSPAQEAEVKASDTSPPQSDKPPPDRPRIP